MRTAVGILGVALPTALLIGESHISRSFEFRGSLSAYYHSSMRDMFVGILWILGFLPIIYRAWKPKTLDFLLSALAGIGAAGVAFFPTTRCSPSCSSGSPHSCA